MSEIILYGLPKVSLNEWYSGAHWSKRAKLKEKYTWLVKSQFKGVFTRDKKYIVDYEFCFKNRPLDASNCVAMVKIVEDIIFETDSYKIVEKISISSRKSETENLKITIYEK